MFLEFWWTTRHLLVDEGEADVARSVLAMWRWQGRHMALQWRASPVIGYGGGGVRGVHRTMESLYEVRDGQNTHWW
jgi:hypothetical protein